MAIFSPNPANGFITIIPGSKMKINLKIYNSIGDIVWEKYGLSLEGNYRLDVSNLRSGLYFFALTGQAASQIEKVIIEN